MPQRASSSSIFVVVFSFAPSPGPRPINNPPPPPPSPSPCQAHTSGRLKVASLFSGCGVLDYGLTQAGHEIVLQTESDPDAREVLAARFQGICQPTDPATVECLPPDADVLAASVVCAEQEGSWRESWSKDSVASKLKQVLRLLKAGRGGQGGAVPWVLVEASTALLESDGEGVPIVCDLVSELERLGYRWAHRTIAAAAFGVPDVKPRVVLLASKHGDPRDVLLTEDAGKSANFLEPPGAETSQAFVFNQSAEGEMRVFSDFVDGFHPGDGGAVMDAAGHLAPVEVHDAERLQGLPPGWTLTSRPPAPGSRVDNAPRWKALAASLGCVPASQWIGSRLAKPYELKHDGRGSAFEAPVTVPWPTAAYNVGHGRAHVACSPFPRTNGGTLPTLGGFISGVVGAGGGGGGGEDRIGGCVTKETALECVKALRAAGWQPPPQLIAVEVAAEAAIAAATAAAVAAGEFGAGGGRGGHVGHGHDARDLASQLAAAAAAAAMGGGGAAHHASAHGVKRSASGDAGAGGGGSNAGRAAALAALGDVTAAAALAEASERSQREQRDHAPRSKKSRGGGGGGGGTTTVGPSAADPDPERAAGDDADADDDDDTFVVGNVTIRSRTSAQVVWAKLPGHPFWPGLRVELERDDVASETLRMRKENEALVVFFGENSFGWVREEQVLDFKDSYADKAREPMRNKARFNAALQEAMNELAKRDDAFVPPAIVQKGKSGSHAAPSHGAKGAAKDEHKNEHKDSPAASGGSRGGGGGSGKENASQAARAGDGENSGVMAAVAAAAAAAVASGKIHTDGCVCRVCAAWAKAPKDEANAGGASGKKNGSSAVCLKIEAQRSAASHPVGAMLALQGEGSVGTAIEIYWPLDQVHYGASIVSFDAVELQHMVQYEADGVREFLCLWNEDVKVVSGDGAAGGAAPSAPRDHGKEAGLAAAASYGKDDMSGGGVAAMETDAKDAAKKEATPEGAPKKEETPAEAAAAAAAGAEDAGDGGDEDAEAALLMGLGSDGEAPSGGGANGGGAEDAAGEGRPRRK